MTQGPERRMMSLKLSSLTAHPRGTAVAPRPLLATDADSLGTLLFDAYHGTIDDRGDSRADARAEVERTFSGVYGRMLWEASFAASDPHDLSALGGASVVTFWENAPLLAFVMTRPHMQRKGVARALIVMTAHALLVHGHTDLTLVVTNGNTSAVRLYESLGFQTRPR